MTGTQAGDCGQKSSVIHICGNEVACGRRISQPSATWRSVRHLWRRMPAKNTSPSAVGFSPTRRPPPHASHDQRHGRHVQPPIASPARATSHAPKRHAALQRSTRTPAGNHPRQPAMRHATQRHGITPTTLRTRLALEARQPPSLRLRERKESTRRRATPRQASATSTRHWDATRRPPDASRPVHGQSGTFPPIAASDTTPRTKPRPPHTRAPLPHPYPFPLPYSLVLQHRAQHCTHPARAGRVPAHAQYQTRPPDRRSA